MLQKVKNPLLKLSLTLMILIEILVYFQFYGGDIFFNLNYRPLDVILFFGLIIPAYWRATKVQLLFIAALQITLGFIFSSYETGNLLFKSIMVIHFIIAPIIYFHIEIETWLVNKVRTKDT